MTATIGGVVDRVAGRLVRPSAGADGVVSVELLDATHDSRAVDRGWLYCCVPGTHFDGHDFAGAAAEAGAGALLVERELPVDRPQILVPDVRAAMGPAAAAVHHDPADELTLVGVTGTNGKSSVVQLMADLWSQTGVRAEIIGTLAGARTTPEATDLQRTLRRAVDRRVEAMAIEVSSHALALHRVAGTRFTISVFTNLTQDHLDFHPTMEDYFAAKARLFTPELTARAVVNADDRWGARLIERAAVPTATYAIDDAEGLRFDGPTSRFRWRGQEIVLQLAGMHNVSNALGAARAAELLGMEPADIADALCATSPVRGRFEAVDAGQPFHIAVDYAHTPDALRAALVAARQVADEGRVIVVFGCGGDRDVEKRAEMGRVAAAAADLVVVTSDNPRSEEPGAIIDDILEGIEPSIRTGGGARVLVEPDRQEAIRAAIAAAADGDLVLIAGKGHETHQIIGDRIIDFDDRQAALVALGVIA
jgi:UDP-N-acetylmuramoyl-L-alanyl-D-glutamate--2,6-diaminopimelate ligase